MTIGNWLALAGIIAPIVGAMLWHIIRDHEIQSRHSTEIERLKTDVGDHDTGMRGQLHKHSNLIGRVQAVAFFIGNKLKLSIMKDLDEDK